MAKSMFWGTIITTLIVGFIDIFVEHLTLDDEGLLAWLQEARHHVQLPVHLALVLDFPTFRG